MEQNKNIFFQSTSTFPTEPTQWRLWKDRERKVRFGSHGESTLAHFGTLRQSALGTCETIHKILHSCTLEKISAQISLKYASVKPICAHSWTFIAGRYFMEHDYLVIFHKLHTSCKRNWRRWKGCQDVKTNFPKWKYLNICICQVQIWAWMGIYLHICPMGWAMGNLTVE